MTLDARPGQVLTVTGPVDAATLGVTDAHEHLFLRSPALAGQEFDDPARAISEVREARAGGVAAIVELTPIGLGRRPDLMREVSDATGVHIVAATGYHRDAHYAPDHWVRHADERTLVERMATDIEHGMHPADWETDAALDPAHAGVIKVGASYQHIGDRERVALRAAALVGRRTGVAVAVHTEVGTAAAEIVQLLTDAGLDADQIVLAHLDRNPDAELHLELLNSGVYLVYDTLGRIKYGPDSRILELIEAGVKAGFGERMMLGLDLGRRDYFRAYGGGPGLRYLMDTFVPRLEKHIGPLASRRMLVDNPAHAYALRSVA